MIPMNLASVRIMIEKAKAGETKYESVLQALHEEYGNLWKFWRAAEDEVTRLRLNRVGAPAGEPAYVYASDGLPCKEVRWRHTDEADIEEATMDGEHWVEISRNVYTKEEETDADS